jgi:hypothetical protein
MVSDMSSTTAAAPYRLVRFRNSTDATRFPPLNPPLAAAVFFGTFYHYHGRLLNAAAA